MRLPLLALVSGLLLLTGCAAERSVMRYSNPGKERLVLPKPPDPPRFLYLGELTGERNFRPESEEVPGAMQSFFQWVVGLADGFIPVLELQRPQSGAVDDDGRIYVTDVSRQAVYVFDEPAGQLKIWEMADASRRFVSPVGVAMGAQGEVLVSDAELGLVARLDRDGNPLGTFGEGVLKRPNGIARDPARGVVYVADVQAHDIKVFSDAGLLLQILGQRGSGDGEFNFPTHLAFARSELYVTDTLNSRIQIYGTDDTLKQQFGSLGLYIGNLVRPKGVALDNEGHVYVVESLYDTLLVFNHEGALLMALGGSGKEPGRFYLPAGVWSDRHNRIYVSDMFNGRVVLYQYLGEPK